MKTWDDYPVLLTIDEAMKLLRIDRKQTVTDLCRKSQIPALKAGRDWRIDRDGLRAMFETK